MLCPACRTDARLKCQLARPASGFCRRQTVRRRILTPIEKREPFAIARGEPLVGSFSSYSSPEILEECLLRRLVPRDNWSRLQDRKWLSFFDRYQIRYTRRYRSSRRRLKC